MLVILGADERIDAHLPPERRRPTLKCSVEIGGKIEPRYRHPAVEVLALIDSGAAICGVRSRIIPQGLFPIAFQDAAANVNGNLSERASYWARITIEGIAAPIEFPVTDYSLDKASCDLILGTPFLVFGKLQLDLANGERFFTVHGDQA